MIAIVSILLQTILLNCIFIQQHPNNQSIGNKKRVIIEGWTWQLGSKLILGRLAIWSLSLFYCIWILPIPFDLVDAVSSALCITGCLIRLWCFHILGRFFTFTLQIQREHRLIRSGPYALLRHPSYSSAYLAFLGYLLFLFRWRNVVAVCGVFGSLAIWTVILVMVGLSFRLIRGRIGKEEEMLECEFKQEWQVYRQSTKMLIPFIF